MNPNTFVNALEQQRLLPIIRLDHGESLQPVISALVSAGIELLEVTANTPGFEKAIPWVRATYPGVHIGVGTVTDLQTAKECVALGAQFLVTPNTNVEMAFWSKDRELPCLMGAMSPTEIQQAHSAGASMVKLFPAAALGTSFLKAVKAPFPEIPIMAVGGINKANAAGWLEAGATALGVGGSLVPRNLLPTADFVQLERAARQWLQVLKP